MITRGSARGGWEFVTALLLLIPLVLSCIGAPLSVGAAADVTAGINTETESDFVNDRSSLSSSSAASSSSVSLRGEIIATDGCHLDLRPALKEFLLDSTNGAQSYDNVNVMLVPGWRPILLLYDDDRQSTVDNDHPMETIQLWNIETKQALHDLLRSKGFVRKIQKDTEDSIPNQQSDLSVADKPTPSSTNDVTPMEAARRAFRGTTSSDTYTKSYAAMNAFLDATSKLKSKEQQQQSISKAKISDNDQQDVDNRNWGYDQMADLIDQKLRNHPYDKNQKDKPNVPKAVAR